jgi:hypothetical protein
MANAQIEFMYGGVYVEFQLVNLSDADAKTLYKIFSKACNSGSNDHIRSFGWQTEIEGVMVTKGEKH